jgi:hypothetical protein
MDGLYTPYALQWPAGDGPHPFVFLAYGNGGGGLGWLRDRVAGYPYVLRRLLATADMTIHFLRRAKSDVRARARIVKKGRRINVGEVDVVDVVSIPTTQLAARHRSGQDRPRRRQPRRGCSTRSLGVPEARSPLGSPASRPTTSSSTSTPTRQ